MLPIPYYLQIILFACLVLGMLIYDRIKPSKEHVRTNEYLFLVLTGIVGAVYGLVNDCFTASISPEYFWLGKGLENGPKLFIESITLGAKAGFSGGVILGGIFLVCRTYLFPVVRFKRILFLMIIPLLLGIAFSIIFPYIFGNYDPQGIGKGLSDLISEGKIYSFLRVWRIHLEAYAGILFGTAAVIIYLKRSTSKKTINRYLKN